MWELRWVLLGLGALLIVGIYVWSKVPALRRSGFRGALPDFASRRRAEPTISGADLSAGDETAELSDSDDAAYSDDGSADVADIYAEEDAAGTQEKPAAPDKVVTLRFVARNETLRCEEAVLALRGAGLQHGQYGIFHRVQKGHPNAPMFSVANLTEPGSFDLAGAADSTLPGMTFFMVLPGTGDPVARFDDMVQTARALAHQLDAELLDDRGSSWSIQRERYIREEVIQYRHQHGYQAHDH